MPKRNGRAGALSGGTEAVRHGGPAGGTTGSDGGELQIPQTRLSAPRTPVRNMAR